VASWPLRSGDPFSDRTNSLPKFVASTTLEEPLEWSSTLLKGDVVDAVAKLKYGDTERRRSSRRRRRTPAPEATGVARWAGGCWSGAGSAVSGDRKIATIRTMGGGKRLIAAKGRVSDRGEGPQPEQPRSRVDDWLA